MRTMIWPLLGAVLLSGLGIAQDDAPPKQDPGARLEALEKGVQEAIEKWREKARTAQQEIAKARKEGKPVPAFPMRPDLEPFVAKFQKAAGDYAGTDDAIPFLSWLMSMGSMFDEDAGEQAIATLAKSHASSDKLIELAPMFPNLLENGPEAAADLIDAVRKENKNINIVAWAELAEHGTTIDEADKESDDYKKARALLVSLAEKVEGEELKAAIKSRIDMRERMGIGGTAPDIVGIDLDGVEFKLSDYKGKIIFLDFWGDW